MKTNNDNSPLALIALIALLFAGPLLGNYLRCEYFHAKIKPGQVWRQEATDYNFCQNYPAHDKRVISIENGIVTYSVDGCRTTSMEESLFVDGASLIE